MEGQPPPAEMHIVLPLDADPERVADLLGRAREAGWQALLVDPANQQTLPDDTFEAGVERAPDLLDRSVFEMLDEHDPPGAQAIKRFLAQGGIGTLRDIVVTGRAPFERLPFPLSHNVSTFFSDMLDAQDPPVVWSPYTNGQVLAKYCDDLSQAPAACLVSSLSLHGLKHDGRVSVADILNGTEEDFYGYPGVPDATTGSIFRKLRRLAEMVQHDFAKFQEIQRQANA